MKANWEQAPPSTAALMVSLEMAVPLKIADLRRVGEYERTALAGEMAEMVAAHADDLMYGGSSCVPTFAALARGLAALAFKPGGVTFWDRHWCAKHAPFGRGVEDGSPHICAGCLEDEAKA